MHRHVIFLCRVSLLFVTLAVSVLLSAGSLWADSFDWRNVNGANWNTPVQNQNGGTCWVFSGVASFEARYKLTRNDPTFDFECSEQQVEWGCGPTQWGGWGDGSVFYSVTNGLVSATECPIDPNSDYWGTPGPTSLWPLAAGWQNRMLVGTNRTVITTTSPNTIQGTSQIVTTTQNIENMLKMYGPMMTAVLLNERPVQFPCGYPGELSPAAGRRRSCRGSRRLPGRCESSIRRILDHQE